MISNDPRSACSKRSASFAIRALLVASTIALGCAAVAQESAPPKPDPAKPTQPAEKPDEHDKKPLPEVKVDDATAALLDRMDALEYRLGDAGVKRVSFRAAAKLESVKLKAPMSGEIHFYWDSEQPGRRSQFRCDPPELEKALKDAGLWPEHFRRNFVHQSWREKWRGCTLSSERLAEGAKIKVDGSRNGIRSMLIDARGLAIESELDAGKGVFQAGGKLFVEYEEFAGKFVPKQTRIQMNVPGQNLETKMSFAYSKVGEYYVCAKLETSTHIDGVQGASGTVELSDYRFNADARPPEEHPH